MRIGLQDVNHVATLARLGLSQSERESLRGELSSILAYVDILNELDTTDVPPASQAIAIENVTRPDLRRPSLTVPEVLANAADQQDGYFRVPPVFDDQ